MVCFCADGFAIRYLTVPEALKAVFPDADSVVAEQKHIDNRQRDRIKQRLGGKLDDWRAELGQITAGDDATYTFYFSLKNQKRAEVAVVETQPGKWGPVEVMVILSISGAVKNAIVLSHNDTKARPICRKAFLNQFRGKSIADPLAIDSDIYAVTGATVSSNAVAFAVKKVIVLYDELFLNGSR
jgi:Na+-translocating ferredoxin:NAD+ oxidoreductase RnfG subunit